MPKIFTDPEFGPVTVTPRSNARRITLRAKPEGVFVSVPPLTPLFLVRRTLEQYRERLRQAVLRALRTSARPLLAARLQDWSRRTGLAFTNLRISTARTRWGSCSARRDISLSCFLILLPEHLSDYVILHELTHTVQMNHGPRFHRLLDELTGGRSAALQQELRTFVPPYPESVQKR